MRRSRTDTSIALFAVLSSLVIVLNILTDRSNFWAIWPIWVLGMMMAGLVLAARWRPHRLLGLWAGTGGGFAAGLFAIDVVDGGNWWFFWPMMAWIVLGVLITGLTVDLLSGIPTSEHAGTDAQPTPPMDTGQK